MAKIPEIAKEAIYYPSVWAGVGLMLRGSPGVKFVGAALVAYGVSRVASAKKTL